MPFTTLNQAVTSQRTTVTPPAWIKQDFGELPDEILESVISLWNGEEKSMNQATAQKVIAELRLLIVKLKGKLASSTNSASSLRAESPSKKRALEDGENTNGSSQKLPRVHRDQKSISGSWKGTRFEGVTFTIPQRKKLTLKVSPSDDEGIIGTAAAEGVDTPEFGIPWSEVDHVMCLPVPEKTQAQKTFVIFPKGVDGLTQTPHSDFDTIVFTAQDTKAKGATEDEPTQAQAIKTAFQQNLNVVEPDPEDFTSEIPPVGAKKGEKSYHIKAHKGSKDGFLFLLPTGILWAFKKPLIYFSFASIDSISYTSVLQRTFNLVITARHVGPSEGDSDATSTNEYEFSMLDQIDFEGIDTYVKKNNLQDASLAADRRAKVYNVNGKKGEVEQENDPDAEGELQKAEREAGAAAEVETSDDEEEDENFDPGSDGESEGSGSGSESEEEAEDGDRRANDDGDEDEEMT